MDSYSIIIKPHVTEKTMNLIDKNNEITFVVKRSFTILDRISTFVKKSECTC